MYAALTNQLPITGQHNERLLQTTCPYCGVGCGVDVIADNKEEFGLRDLTGSSDHPANFGRLCIKGTHLLETLSPEKRLLNPTVFGKQVSWDTAISTVAEKISHIVKEYGPEAMAIYGSGQLLTEDYYVANKFMKGFIGSANIDTNSRLCMSSAVVAHKRAFGEDIVPCNYEDLEHTDLLILVGSNAAWTHPVLFQRMERAKLRNPQMKIVVVDPRATDSTSIADLHLGLKAGSDSALFCGLLHFLHENNHLDSDFIQTSTSGFESAIEAAAPWTLEQVAQSCDLPIHTIQTLYQWFSQLPRVVTFFSMGINQSTSGVDKGNAIINCHLATGKIGRDGCGPFSITGQPNAMGGREVGGLSNMLAAHMDIENPEHHTTVKRFWQAPNLVNQPGLRAVDMFKAVAEGKVKCIWIMATNPVASMPNRALIEAALKKCELVIVSETAATNDTLQFADIALPATGWSEKNGTVTNSERRISRQRGLVIPTGQAKHDWEIISLVARAMGFEKAFDYQHPVDIFTEHCALTAANNHGSRALDLGSLATLSRGEYDNLRPVQWPLNNQQSNNARLFANGKFYTQDKKAKFISITPKLPEQQTSSEYPYILNTGRIRDQWHTMTRTGNAPRLLKHLDRPWLSIHPLDAKSVGIKEGQLVALSSACNQEIKVVLPAKFDNGQRKGECFAPFHWSATWGSHCKVGALLTGANDPLSGQPELKHAAVNLTPVSYNTYGKLYGNATYLAEIKRKCDYWLDTPTIENMGSDIADSSELMTFCADVMSCLPTDTQWTSYQSANKATIVVTKQDKLVLVIMLSDAYVDIPMDWLDSLYTQEKQLTPEQINGLLEHQADEAFRLGKLVCSCHGVREKTITDAINQGVETVAGLGKALKCGTNCGSCKSELASLIKYTSAKTPLASTKETENESVI